MFSFCKITLYFQNIYILVKIDMNFYFRLIILDQILLWCYIFNFDCEECNFCSIYISINCSINKSPYVITYNWHQFLNVPQRSIRLIIESERNIFWNYIIFWTRQFLLNILNWCSDYLCFSSWTCSLWLCSYMIYQNISKM